MGALQRSLQLHEESRLGQRRVLGGKGGDLIGTHNNKPSRHEMMAARTGAEVDRCQKLVEGGTDRVRSCQEW